MKNELENISEDRGQESKTPGKKQIEGTFKETIRKETKLSPYFSIPEKIAEERIVKLGMDEKRKSGLLKAQSMLEAIEKKVVKLEQIYIK